MFSLHKNGPKSNILAQLRDLSDFCWCMGFVKMLIMVIFWQFVCILRINCLNLGIAQKEGEGVLGLPKLFGALFFY